MTGLAVAYFAAAAANLVAAGTVLRAVRRAAGRWRAAAWSALAGLFALGGCRALAGVPPQLPEAIKTLLDAAAHPAWLTLISAMLLAGSFLARRWLVAPAVAWAVFNLSLAVLLPALADQRFAALVLAPDHVALVAMVYLLGFFTWLGAAQAVENDRRAAEGRGPIESELAEREKVLVWPDLVQTELIVAIALCALLILWSLGVPAPLEGPADPRATPNPSKAPWYFVGLQELLVYSDAWYAGVVVPCLIILGLMAVPYLDRNPLGNGYYTIRARQVAYVAYQFGFLQLWILLILIGTFIRGPNWAPYGPFEPREPQATAVAARVGNLSEWFWTDLLGRPMPQPAAGADGLGRLGAVMWRELPGVALLGAYVLVLPPVLGRTLLQRWRLDLGAARSAVLVVLLLFMLSVPAKMILYWSFGIGRVLSMPEYLLSF